MRRIAPLLFLSCLLLGSFGAGHAHASRFEISPVSVTLSSKVTSSLLTISNRSSEALRFHISVSAWDQRNGEMILGPTKDIVFFPAMLTLAPNEARKLRVGMNVKAGAVEKSYRIFVQELPPAVKADDPGAVRVLTKMGIPIFIEALAPKAVPTLSALSLAGNQLSFTVKNPGNTRYRAGKIVVTARDAKKALHAEEITGWYVLAGGSQQYVVTLPPAACSKLTSIDIDVETDMGPAKATLPEARCGR